MNKKVIIAVSIAAALLGALLLLWLSSLGGKNDNTIIRETGFSTVLPDNKSIDDLGGWSRVSPPDKEPAFAYTDSIAGVKIIVSQQPLPKDFSLAETARSFNATRELPAGNIKTYIGSSAEGVQFVIFNKNKLLILIRSQAQISDDSWVQYIESLS